MKRENPVLNIAFGLLKCVGYLAVWFLAQSAVVVFAQVLLMAKFPGMSDDLILETLNAHLVEITVLANGVSILLFALICSARKTSFFEEAHYNKMPSRYIFTTLAFGVACMYAVAIIIGLIPFPEKWIELLSNQNAPIVNASPAMQFLMAVIFAPLLEETLFRGLIIGTLKKDMHPVIAVIISSVMFGFAHGSPFDMETGNPIGFIYSLCLGLVMGWIFVKFDSVLPTILFHMAYNFAVTYASEEASVAILVLCVPIIIYEAYVIFKYKKGE